MYEMAKRINHKKELEEAKDNWLRVHGKLKEAEKKYEDFDNSKSYVNAKKRMDDLEEDYINISARYNEIKEKWKEAKLDFASNCKVEGGLFDMRQYWFKEERKAHLRFIYWKNKVEGRK